MRWPWIQRHGRDRWADLAYPDAAERERIAELAADMQAEAAALARALDGPTMLLQSGVRIPGYLTHFDGGEL